MKLKVKRSELKTCYCAYLYEDGHMVLIHEKTDKDAGRVSWVTIYESVGIKCQFKGRLIIDPAALPFVLIAQRIVASEPSVKNGSTNTKRLGLRTGSITLYNGHDHRGWILPTFPDLLTCDLKYQIETAERFEDFKDGHMWGMDRIKKVYNLKKEVA